MESSHSEGVAGRISRNRDTESLRGRPMPGKGRAPSGAHTRTHTHSWARAHRCRDTRGPAPPSCVDPHGLPQAGLLRSGDCTAGLSAWERTRTRRADAQRSLSGAAEALGRAPPPHFPRPGASPPLLPVTCHRPRDSSRLRSAFSLSLCPDHTIWSRVRHPDPADWTRAFPGVNHGPVGAVATLAWCSALTRRGGALGVSERGLGGQ